MKLPKILERFDPKVSRRRRLLAITQRILFYFAIFLTGYIVATIRYLLA